MSDNLFNMRPQALAGILFIAKVVNNNDLGRREGEVSIRIPTRMDGIPDEHLPWARPKNLGYSFKIPDVGELVYVEFLGGSVYHPVYYGKAIGPNGVGIFTDDYPNSWGISDGTNYIKINKASNTMEFTSGSGATLKFDPDNGLIDVPKDFKINAGQNVEIHCIQAKIECTTAEIQAEGTITATGSAILLNS